MGRLAGLRAIIAKYPRVGLGHFPTPLEPLHRLYAWVAGPSLYIKRDDASGLGQGGNKVRALEYIVADAQAAGADTLLTAGVIQSNSVRQIAAAAAKVGLDCHFAMITDRVNGVDRDYASTGNIFLNQLFGATHENISVEDDRATVLNRLAERLRSQGRKPYIVPYGCANRLGAMGYLHAAIELFEQSEQLGILISHVVHASGTGGTQASLIVGFAALGIPVEVIGVDIDADPAGVRRRVSSIVNELAEAVGLDGATLEGKIIIEPNHSAGAYGKADQATVDTIRLAARLEGLTVDPVYSGKALSALIGLARGGTFKKTDNVVFLHTGGTPAIYAYRSLFGFDEG